jgi:hypothetical protein
MKLNANVATASFAPLSITRRDLQYLSIRSEYLVRTASLRARIDAPVNAGNETVKSRKDGLLSASCCDLNDVVVTRGRIHYSSDHRPTGGLAERPACVDFVVLG